MVWGMSVGVVRDGAAQGTGKSRGVARKRCPGQPRSSVLRRPSQASAHPLPWSLEPQLLTASAQQVSDAPWLGRPEQYRLEQIHGVLSRRRLAVDLEKIVSCDDYRS